jgi:hypothetical protein
MVDMNESEVNDVQYEVCSCTHLHVSYFEEEAPRIRVEDLLTGEEVEVSTEIIAEELGPDSECEVEEAVNSVEDHVVITLLFIITADSRKMYPLIFAHPEL